MRRQHPCGSYGLDSACIEKKLAVELDCDTHVISDRCVRDAFRTAYLAGQGWRVLRFSNREVFANPDGVLQTIAAALQGHHLDPLPGEEGG